jgi:hypothetical protein
VVVPAVGTVTVSVDPLRDAVPLAVTIEHTGRPFGSMHRTRSVTVNVDAAFGMLVQTDGFVVLVAEDNVAAGNAKVGPLTKLGELPGQPLPHAMLPRP